MAEKFRPTVEWMKENYNKMNHLLFNGSLGACNFEVFTTGKGSNGNVLGWFKMKGNFLCVEGRRRRMYKDIYGEKRYITKDNFVEFCHPTIELNGNYLWTEKAMLTTLVHEMCHYYTYMNGYSPGKAHGVEFREIAMRVSSKSNSFFTIQRLASAERLEEMELDATIQKRNEERAKRKIESMQVIVIKFSDGRYEVTTTSNHSLISKIYYESQKNPDVDEIITSSNDEVLELLCNNGYNRNMRKWICWSDAEVKKIIDSTNKDCWKVLYSKVKFDNNEKKDKMHKFRIKTSVGEVVIEFNDEDDLFNKLRKRFPKATDETIRKIMFNPNNYINESINRIIKQLLKEYIDKNNEDDVIKINPNMNLGLYAPYEF
jgi:predicted SprT family Zn-dependent metalloprotease